MKIVVLANDATLFTLICPILQAAGHSVHSVSNGNDTLRELCHDNTDMLIVSGTTKEKSRTPILKQVRENFPPHFPILLILNRSDEEFILHDLAAGANDYLFKPVRQHELVTRVRVLLQRAYPNYAVTERVEFAPFIFEFSSNKVWFQERLIVLTQKEFDLAVLLFRHANHPLSRAFMLETLWPNEKESLSRTLDTHISRVRVKLKLVPQNGFRLAPVYSYGYKLEQMNANYVVK